jgi:hypothetical protein
MAKKKTIKEDNPVKLNIPFEDAMRKALNTPLPVKKAGRKSGKGKK